MLLFLVKYDDCDSLDQFEFRHRVRNLLSSVNGTEYADFGPGCLWVEQVSFHWVGVPVGGIMVGLHAAIVARVDVSGTADMAACEKCMHKVFTRVPFDWLPDPVSCRVVDFSKTFVA